MTKSAVEATAVSMLTGVAAVLASAGVLKSALFALLPGAQGRRTLTEALEPISPVGLVMLLSLSLSLSLILMVVLALLGEGKSVGEGKLVIWALIPHGVGRAVLTEVPAAALPEKVGVKSTGVSEGRVALLGVSESTIRVSMVIKEGEVA